MDLQHLSKQTTEGCDALGLHGNIIACGATKTLVAADSGSLVTLDQSTGSALTLPAAPVAGMFFDIAVSVSVVASDVHVITVATTASQFLIGGIQMMIDTTAVSEGQFLNGTSHITLTMNGSTTGGLIGTVLRFTAINSTQWMVTGLVAGSGTLATPATT